MFWILAAHATCITRPATVHVKDCELSATPTGEVVWAHVNQCSAGGMGGSASLSPLTGALPDGEPRMVSSGCFFPEPLEQTDSDCSGYPVYRMLRSESSREATCPTTAMHAYTNGARDAHGNSRIVSERWTTRDHDGDCRNHVVARYADGTEHTLWSRGDTALCALPKRERAGEPIWVTLPPGTTVFKGLYDPPSGVDRKRPAPFQIPEEEATSGFVFWRTERVSLAWTKDQCLEIRSVREVVELQSGNLERRFRTGQRIPCPNSEPAEPTPVVKQPG